MNPVRLAVFSQALADPESEQVRRLVEELAALDPRLTAEPCNFVLDKESVDELGHRAHPRDRHPGRGEGLRHPLYGLPSGYEFGSLVDAILDVSRGRRAGSREETRDGAGGARARPSTCSVFSTPT